MIVSTISNFLELLNPYKLSSALQHYLVLTSLDLAEAGDSIDHLLHPPLSPLTTPFFPLPTFLATPSPRSPSLVPSLLLLPELSPQPSCLLTLSIVPGQFYPLLWFTNNSL